MLAIICVGSGAQAFYVIISSCNTTGRAQGCVFLLLNQISSFTFIVLLLHKSEKGKFVVKPGFFFPFLSRQANDFLLLIHPSKWFMGAKKPTPSPLQNKQSLKSCNGAQKLRAAAFDTFNFSKNMLLFYFPIYSVSTFSTNNKISCFTVSLIRFSSFHPKQRAENANLSVRRLH